MREIVIISGKGGTGKTVITASFAAIARNKVMADCDVDAADLHLLLLSEIRHKEQFKSGYTPEIDKNICTKCGKCMEVCRFNAVKSGFVIDPIACEGCGFCRHVCPSGAIIMKENITGEWYISDTRFGRMVHAKLGIGEENSGKLVSLVKKEAKKIAEENNLDWIIVDGSPGIGCPVIASISGADLAVVVTEPTMSGLHDAERVIKVTEHFKVPVKLIINKYDLNEDMAKEIEEYCIRGNVEVLGKISFDDNIVKAMVGGKTIIEYDSGRTTGIIRGIWDNIKKILG